jgi:outer membrane autotransporter protein
VAVPATAFFPVGTQFNIVQTQTGTVQSGTNGTVVVVVNDPTNPLYTFSAVPAAGTVAGEVSIVTTGIPLLVPVAPPAGVVLPPVAPVAAPVVPVILAAAAVAPPTSDLVSTVLPAINAISNPTTVVNAIAQLAPSTPDLAAGRVAFETAREFQNILSSRLDDSLCGGGQSDERRRPDDPRRRDDETSSCPENGPYNSLWVKGFGYFGNQGAEGPYPGYDSTIAGVMMGFDQPLADDTRVGLAIGFARSTIDGKIFVANTGFDTYQGMIYINHETKTWFADGDVSYGHSDYSETRDISFPGINRIADGKYGGNDTTAYLTTGYHFLTDGVAITPLASLQATFIGLNAYTETGATDLDLKIASQNYDFLESGLGVSVADYFAMSDGIDGLPELHFKWLHELVNPTLENTATLTAAGSSSLTTPGLRSAPDTLDAGAGLTLLSCASCGARTWSVEAVYDYYWRNDDYSAQQVMLQISDRF